jgi:hypothetical protein
MISFDSLQVTNYIYKKLDRKNKQELPLDPFRWMEILESDGEKVYFLYYDRQNKFPSGFAVVSIIDHEEDAGVSVNIEFAITPFTDAVKFYRQVEYKIVDLLFYDFFFIVFYIHPVNEHIFEMLIKKFDYLVGDTDLKKIIEFTPRQQQ